MKFFKKKYQYILPMLCVASFSAQATYKNETLEEERALKAAQNKEYKDTLYADMILSNPVLLDLEKKLKNAQATLEAHEGYLNQYPENLNISKKVKDCLASIQQIQSQIDLQTASLKKDFEKECEALNLTLSSSSPSQNTENMGNENSELLSKEFNKLTIGEKFENLPDDLQLIIIIESSKKIISEGDFPLEFCFVNKKWNQWMHDRKSPLFKFLKEAELKVEIFHEDFADVEAKKINKLKNNKWAKSITLHIDFDQGLDIHHANLEKVILEGLQNKPNLKKLTILGDFSVDSWLNIQFQSTCLGNNINLDPMSFFDLPHMKCFLNLEEIVISKRILGGYRNDFYFLTRLVPLMTSLKKITTQNLSIDGTNH